MGGKLNICGQSQQKWGLPRRPYSPVVVMQREARDKKFVAKPPQRFTRWRFALIEPTFSIREGLGNLKQDFALWNETEVWHDGRCELNDSGSADPIEGIPGRFIGKKRPMDGHGIQQSRVSASDANFVIVNDR